VVTELRHVFIWTTWNKIGNWTISDPSALSTEGTVIPASAFAIGPLLANHGPYPTYKSWVHFLVLEELKYLGSEALLESSRYLVPLIEKFLKNLESNTNIQGDKQFVFIHGDLDDQNILVELEESQDGVPKVKITAILDWEWSGSFPSSEEYFLSFKFLGDEDSDPQHKSSVLSTYTPLQQVFFSILESKNVDTPRTNPLKFSQHKSLNELRGSIAPWYLRELLNPNNEDAIKEREKARQTVERALSELQKDEKSL